MRAPATLPARLAFKFLKLFFKLLYNQLAWTYDFVAAVVSVGMWKQWLLEVLPYLEGPRILELGHGPGHLQAALHRKDQKVVGLDESRYMGRIAIKRLLGLGFTPGLVNGYAQFLPFASSSFQQVVATFPSDYIVQPHTLAEVHRVLAPGGELVILPIAWLTGRRLIYRLAAALFRITAQAPGMEVDLRPAFIEPFQKAGFITQVERLTLPNSLLVLIRATKPL